MAVHFPPSIKWKPKRELRSQRVVGQCPCPGELGPRPSRRVENPPEKVSSSCHWAPEVSSCQEAWWSWSPDSHDSAPGPKGWPSGPGSPLWRLLSRTHMSWQLALSINLVWMIEMSYLSSTMFNNADKLIIWNRHFLDDHLFTTPWLQARYSWKLKERLIIILNNEHSWRTDVEFVTSWY